MKSTLILALMGSTPPPGTNKINSLQINASSDAFFCAQTVPKVPKLALNECQQRSIGLSQGELLKRSCRGGRKLQDFLAQTVKRGRLTVGLLEPFQEVTNVNRVFAKVTRVASISARFIFDRL
jgi:hypothetical protein